MDDFGHFQANSQSNWTFLYVQTYIVHSFASSKLLEIQFLSNSVQKTCKRFAICKYLYNMILKSWMHFSSEWNQFHFLLSYNWKNIIILYAAHQKGDFAAATCVSFHYYDKWSKQTKSGLALTNINSDEMRHVCSFWCAASYNVTMQIIEKMDQKLCRHQVLWY